MFDPSAPHIIILLVVVLLLFGSTRLPGAAEALGKSMRIFKREARKLNDEDDKPAEATVTQVTAVHQPASQPVLPNTAATPASPTPAAPAATPAAPADSTQRQIQELQRQIQDLQAQRDQQPL